MIDLSKLGEFSASALLNPNSNEGCTGVSFASIELFFEDPENARKTYDQQALDELVNSMLAKNKNTGEARGVLQPLSVKNHPETKEGFLINAGHRRYRAAKLAGLKEIPYFIDNDVDEMGNVVDNLMREDLKLEDMAIFVKKQMELGMKAGEIAKSLGKPNSFVSDYLTYFEMNPNIQRLLEKNYTYSMQTLARLHRAYKKYPSEVDAFCLGIVDQVTAKQVTDFIAELKSAPLGSDPVDQKDESLLSSETPDDTKNTKDQKDNADKNKKPKLDFIQVEYEGSLVKLLINKQTKKGWGWVKDLDQEELEVELCNLKLISLE